MERSETIPKARFVTLPWGRAEVIDEATFESADAEGTTVTIGVAHLRDAGGGELVRFFYRSNGRTVRGPLTLRADDRAGLRAALAASPRLRKLVRELVA